MKCCTTEIIVWRSIYLHGHEYCEARSSNDACQLAGVAVFGMKDAPARLEYLIECDLNWRTLSAKVTGRVGTDEIFIVIAVGPDQTWRINGVEEPAVSECIDIDLNFSPSTNLLPIRRSRLQVGEQQAVSAAWLRFPTFKLERLDQSYTRLDETTYRYESGGGKFIADLKVNEFGLVTNYPGIWEEEVGSHLT